MENEQTPLQYHNILADCIDRVLAGEKTIADCVNEYPAYAESLRLELSVALLAARLKLPRMEAESVNNLENRLRGRLPGKSRGRIIPFPALSRAAAIVLIALFMAFAGGGGAVVAASADTLPGETLYPVKRAWENIIIIIASITGQLDEVWLRLAQTRLDEALRLAERNQLVNSALDDLYRASENALTHASEDTYLVVMTFLAETHTKLIEDERVMAHESAPEMLIFIRNTIDAAQGPGVPPSLATLAPTPTQTLIPTDTATATQTSTLTATYTETATDTPTATDLPPTRTPRIEDTPTRTPTLPPTETAVQPQIIPSATWTPLPPPSPVVQPGQPGQPPPLPIATATLAGEGMAPQPTPTWYPWIRATRDAFYLTRTAEVATATQAANE